MRGRHMHTSSINKWAQEQITYSGLWGSQFTCNLLVATIENDLSRES